MHLPISILFHIPVLYATYAEICTCGNNANYELNDNEAMTINRKSVMEQCSGLDKTNAKNVIINIVINTICEYPFSSCRNLASNIIKDSSKSICGHGFQSCSILASIRIPNGVISNGSRAFELCK